MKIDQVWLAICYLSRSQPIILRLNVSPDRSWLALACLAKRDKKRTKLTVKALAKRDASWCKSVQVWLALTCIDLYPVWPGLNASLQMVVYALTINFFTCFFFSRFKLRVWRDKYRSRPIKRDIHVQRYWLRPIRKKIASHTWSVLIGLVSRNPERNTFTFWLSKKLWKPWQRNSPISNCYFSTIVTRNISPENSGSIWRMKVEHWC